MRGHRLEFSNKNAFLSLKNEIVTAATEFSSGYSQFAKVPVLGVSMLQRVRVTRMIYCIHLVHVTRMSGKLGEQTGTAFFESSSPLGTHLIVYL